MGFVCSFALLYSAGFLWQQADPRFGSVEPLNRTVERRRWSRRAAFILLAISNAIVLVSMGVEQGVFVWFFMAAAAITLSILVSAFVPRHHFHTAFFSLGVTVLSVGLLTIGVLI